MAIEANGVEEQDEKLETPRPPLQMPAKALLIAGLDDAAKRLESIKLKLSVKRSADLVAVMWPLRMAEIVAKINRSAVELQAILGENK